MAQAEKQLLIRLVARADGQPVIAGFGRTLSELASSENRLQTEIRETNAEARRQSAVFGQLTGSTMRWLGVLGGGAGLALVAKKTFDYNQELEGTQIAIAGLLYANSRYTDSLGNVVDRSTAFEAANAESLAIMGELQRESLKTAATVPQIADAFAIVYGALGAAGIKVENSAIVQLTTRLTQAANAMKVPMEQIRQEINSLLTGQITQDSIIAKRLGLDNASVKRMQANGTLVAEVMRRTEGYAKAAEAQSNTLRGKLVNTIEMVTATLSRAFGPALDRSKGALDSIFNFFAANGDKIASFVQRVTLGIESVGRSITSWIRTHRDFVEEILSIGAVAATAVAAYGLIGAAIAAITSPITLTIGGIIALAYAWEKARKLSEIEVGGRPIAAYMRATAQLVASAWIGSIALQIGAVKTLYYVTKATFGALADLMLAPVHFVVGRINAVLQGIPASVGKLIPGFDSLKQIAGDIETRLSKAFTPLDNATKAFETIKETASLSRELARVAGEKAGAALNTKEGFGSVTDMVKGAWGAAADWLDAQLPDLTALGKKASAALGLTSTSTIQKPNDPAAAARASKAAENLKRERDEYFRFITDYRNEARAQGDPLSHAFAKIESDRDEAISKLRAQQKQLKGVLSDAVFESGEAAINNAFDARAADARRKSLEGVKQDLIASLRLQNDLTVGAQRDTEDRRIALIRNSVERELAERLAANRRWLEDESERVTTSIANETERAFQIGLLAEERKRRDDRDRDDADRQMRESTFGYAEYWTKLGESIKAQWRTIGQVIADVVLQSRSLLADTVNDFLGDLMSGQTDLLKSLTGLSKGLTSLWTKALTDILMSGKAVAKQLKDLFKSIHVKNEDGSTDTVGTALQGAAFGSMVGGFFQTESNYAGLGGSIGGALGAVLGTLLGNTGLGAVIGTAIGTAVGSLVQKGKDSIRVAIVDGVVTVTETGISGDARRDVQTQIQRKVREEMKSWQSLLDLFPQSVRDHLSKLYANGKLAKPSLNLTGGVESADLTDEGALNALADFIGNDLPRATFEAYRGAIGVALGQLGVGAARMRQLFEYWGTLQGKELHGAVERYVRVMLDAADIRGKLNAPIEEKLLAASKLSGSTPAQKLSEISAAIDAAVERMAGLRDIEDIVAAQEEVNRLSRQYYETQLQYLARIQQIQQTLATSFGAQREQIQLAGKSDQGKVDFFFDRMVQLRAQLMAATDPEEIGRLAQQIQQYISQAFGLAPENGEMHDKLLAIIGDIESIANSQLEKAKKETVDKDARPASALERAAELLLKAAEDLSNATKPTPTTPPPGGVPDRGDIERPPREVEPNGGGSNVAVMTQLIDRIDTLVEIRESELRALRQWTDEAFAAIRNSQREGAAPPRPEDFGAAVRDALRGMEFTVDEPLVIDNGDLGEQLVTRTERRVIARLRDDPYQIIPRAA